MNTATVYLKADEMKAWQKIQASKLLIQKWGGNWWNVELGFRDYFNLNTILKMENISFTIIGEMKGNECGGQPRYFSLTGAELSEVDKRFVGDCDDDYNWYITFSSPCPPEFDVKISKFMGI